MNVNQLTPPADGTSSVSVSIGESLSEDGLQEVSIAESPSEDRLQ